MTETRGEEQVNKVAHAGLIVFWAGAMNSPYPARERNGISK